MDGRLARNYIMEGKYRLANMVMKIRIDPLDKLDILFSKYIRLRDKVCQRCDVDNMSKLW